MGDQRHMAEWRQKLTDPNQGLACPLATFDPVFLDRRMRAVPEMLEQTRQQPNARLDHRQVTQAGTSTRQIDGQPYVTGLPGLRLDHRDGTRPIHLVGGVAERLLDRLTRRIIGEIGPRRGIRRDRRQEIGDIGTGGHVRHQPRLRKSTRLRRDG